jgi:hypothetical protein
MKRGGKIAPKPRSAKERTRIYGTPAHQDWLRAHGCVGCCTRPVELHHVRNGGTGRKADAEWQVPMCAPCHRLYHQHGAATYEAAFAQTLGGRTLRQCALWYKAAWRSYSTGLVPLSAIVPGVVAKLTEGTE